MLRTFAPVCHSNVHKRTSNGMHAAARTWEITGGSTMRFSFWPNPSQPYADVLMLARHVEQTGWDGFWYADHFMQNAEDTHAAWPEAWTTLAAIGAQVPRLRIGTLVSGNTDTQPCWQKWRLHLITLPTAEWFWVWAADGRRTSTGNTVLALARPGRRLRKLDEACQVITALFGQHQANFCGEFYQHRRTPHWNQNPCRTPCR